MPAINPGEPRRSHALEALTLSLRDASGLYILDLGAANQANIEFFTGLGHRLYAEDLLRSAEAFFTPEEWSSGEASPARIEEFLDSSLNLPDQSADAVLLWDVYQFLPAAVRVPLLERIHRLMAPESRLMAIFHPEGSGPEGQPHTCRVLDGHTVQMTARARLRPLTGLSNRAIERLFQRFGSLKFFLTREALSEVLVRR